MRARYMGICGRCGEVILAGQDIVARRGTAPRHTHCRAPGPVPVPSFATQSITEEPPDLSEAEYVELFSLPRGARQAYLHGRPAFGAMRRWHEAQGSENSEQV